MNCLSGETIEVGICWIVRPGLSVGTTKMDSFFFFGRQIAVAGDEQHRIGLIDRRDVVLLAGNHPSVTIATCGGLHVVVVEPASAGQPERHLRVPSASDGSHSRFIASLPCAAMIDPQIAGEMTQISSGIPSAASSSTMTTASAIPAAATVFFGEVHTEQARITEIAPQLGDIATRATAFQKVLRPILLRDGAGALPDRPVLVVIVYQTGHVRLPAFKSRWLLADECLDRLLRVAGLPDTAKPSVSARNCSDKVLLTLAQQFSLQRKAASRTGRQFPRLRQCVLRTVSASTTSATSPTVRPAPHRPEDSRYMRRARTGPISRGNDHVPPPSPDRPMALNAVQKTVPAAATVMSAA